MTMPPYESPFTAEERQELAGLPKDINQALNEHPGWYDRKDGTPTCQGVGCRWVREGQRGSTAYQYRRHQTHMIRDAVGRWYLDNTDPS